MKNLLQDMLKDLSGYHNDRSELMSNYISERLDKSFNEYDKELKQSIQFLTRKHEKSIIKRMNTLDGNPN